MNNTIAIETMQSLVEMLHDVSDASVQRYAAGLGPVKKGEVAIGRLHNEETRRLFVLASRLDRLEDQAIAAKGLVDEPEKQEKLAEEAGRYGQYRRMVEQLRWCQIHEDLGGYWRHDIGVRQGWVIVQVEPISDSIKNRVREMMGGME